MNQKESGLCSCFATKGDAGDERSNLCVCKLEKEFIERTSCHGISYWCNSVNEFQRILWILLVLGSTAGMVHQVYTRVDNYFEYATSTEVSREFTDEIDFPAVTFCNYNRYFANNLSDSAELAGFHLLNRITSPSFTAYANQNGITVPLTAFDQFDAVTNFTVSGYLDEKGYKLDPETLIDCRFGARRCVASDFTAVITRMGKCYTFNANTSSHEKQTVAGFGKGLSLILNVHHTSYTEEPIYGQLEAGIMFQVHSKYQPPNVDRYGIGIPVGHKAFAVISRKDSEIMYSPWGQCYPENQKTLKYFPVYSVTTCMMECYTDVLIATCACRTFDQYWASDYATECTPREVENCSTPLINRIEHTLTPESCGCTIPCSFTEYTTVPSYATAPSLPNRRYVETAFGIPPSFSLVEENFLALEVTFPEIAYTKETQTKKVDEGGLISDIGGQLGLWVGMSFLTLGEFIQYFANRIWNSLKWSHKKMKKTNKISEMKDEKSPSTWETNIRVVDVY